MKAMQKCFNNIIIEKLHDCFTIAELELMLCGVDKFDVEDWKANTNYIGGYNTKSTQIICFWNLVEDMSDESRPNFSSLQQVQQDSHMEASLTLLALQVFANSLLASLKCSTRDSILRYMKVLKGSMNDGICGQLNVDKNGAGLPFSSNAPRSRSSGRKQYASTTLDVNECLVYALTTAQEREHYSGCPQPPILVGDYKIQAEFLLLTLAAINFTPTQYAFALRTMKHCRRYCSPQDDRSAVTRNAFSIPQTNQALILQPPIAVIPRVIQKVKRDGAIAALILPSWLLMKYEAMLPQILN
ncbi:MAG: hypothetical protein EZS28_035241, partial [Streblomastix strix]